MNKELLEIRKITVRCPLFPYFGGRERGEERGREEEGMVITLIPQENRPLHTRWTLTSLALVY